MADSTIDGSARSDPDTTAAWLYWPTLSQLRCGQPEVHAYARKRLVCLREPSKRAAVWRRLASSMPSRRSNARCRERSMREAEARCFGKVVLDAQRPREQVERAREDGHVRLGHEPKAYSLSVQTPECQSPEGQSPESRLSGAPSPRSSCHSVWFTGMGTLPHETRGSCYDYRTGCTSRGWWP